MKSWLAGLDSKVLTLLQRKMSASQIIALSFILVIIVGALLLFLPISQAADVDVKFIDALFTSASAVCVTGLTTVTTATTWNIVGKTVILCLIQIGGLSLITIFTYFTVHLGRKITLKERLTVQAAFNVNEISGMVRMVLLVIRGTLLCEGIGAVVLFGFFLKQGLPWYQAIYSGLFHSVSAFCNAGFDLVGENSFVPYAGSVVLNFMVMGLIVLGGIGFSVWRDMYMKFRYHFAPRPQRRPRLSLHSKLALGMTGVLLTVGALYFFISEYSNPGTLGPFSIPQKMLASVFQSVTLRTAGFSTIAQSALKDSSKLVSSIFMLIGGSPGGTAGGIKTVTIAIVLCSVWSTIRGYNQITVFERTIPIGILQRALTIIVIMLALWLTGTMFLLVSEQSSVFPHSAVDLLFEVSSALGTVGLTTGVTPFLTAFGKCIIIACMVIGRIGPIAIIISLLSSTTQVNERIQYPDEDVMIG
ncbi:MAG: potassium transporter TrkG [Bacillota bacterium]